MKKTFCDVHGCEKEAWNDAECCYGYLSSSESSSEGKVIFKPFEKSDVNKKDLCLDHYRMWCEATYNVLNSLQPIPVDNK